MKAHELLTVFLKAIGIWLIVNALGLFPNAIGGVHKYNDAETLYYMMLGTFAGPVIAILSGGWLIVATDWFVKLAYRDSVGTESDDATPKLSAPELFGAILKAIGIWDIVMGLVSLPGAIGFAHVYPESGGSFNQFLDTLALPSIAITFGCCFFFATDWFVQKAFPANLVTEHGESNIRRPSETSELFVVILKAIGIWVFVNGSVHLPSQISRFSHYREPKSVFIVMLETFAFSLIQIFIGCCMFFGTNWFVRMAWPEPVSAEYDETKDGTPPASQK